MNNKENKIKDDPLTLKSALTKFQDLNIKALKDSINPHFKSKYADLTSVINAVNQLATEGFPIKLTLIGENFFDKIGKNINKLVKEVNIENKIIDWHQNVSIDEVKNYYHLSDCFIFASTCENMPNILIEAMSSGLPIISSNSGPMKEFLKDSGIYFNPLSVIQLKKSILMMINDVGLRKKLSRKAYELSFNYSWQKCSKKTILYLTDRVKQ